MDTFKTTLPVNYYEINNHKEASPVAVLNYLEEAAIRHSESVGCGIERLLSNGQGWLLTRWSLRMKRYPKWREMVQVETWPFKFERFYATREFKITDGDGELLGAATTLWVFFDLNRKRPLRIPAEITDAYGTGPVRMVEDSFPELPGVSTAEGLASGDGRELAFRVRLSDIDTNDHVNNTKYVEWLMETVPLSVHKECMLSSVEVVYKKETVYGAYVLCEIQEELHESLRSQGQQGLREKPQGNFQGEPPARGSRTFLHRITDKETGAELSRARTVWTFRD